MTPPPGTGAPAAGAVVINADGGSRGNPGPAGYGAVVFDAAGTVLAERSAALGVTTNNVAEYSGLIAGLQAALELGATRVTARLDSKLVVEQMSGRWKIKNSDLQTLAAAAQDLLRRFDRVDFEWVPRAQNAHADRLANEAMDAAAGDAGQSRDVGSGVIAPPPADPGTPDADRPDPAALAPAVPVPFDTANGATRFVIVRHGQTTWGAQMRFAGREDVPLTERGRGQAVAVAKRISALDPTLVLASPLQRCRDTAQAIADEAGTTVQVDERLVDGLLGVWAGFSADQIAERWPAEFAAWRSDPAATPPGGESFTGIRERVTPVIDDVITAHPGTTVVLVTHAAPAKMILAAALGADSAVAYRLRIDTGSLSGFTVRPSGDVMVWAVNETGHLLG